MRSDRIGVICGSGVCVCVFLSVILSVSIYVCLKSILSGYTLNSEMGLEVGAVSSGPEILHSVTTLVLNKMLLDSDFGWMFTHSLWNCNGYYHPSVPLKSYKRDKRMKYL